MAEWLQALHDWEAAALIRRSAYVYPLVNAAHIFSLALLIGSILPIDLRMLGFFPSVSAAPFLRLMTAIAGVGLALAVITGFLLFSVQPLKYAGNAAFLTKISLVALGTGNAAIIRFSPDWKQAVKDGAVSKPLRIGAALSLAIWIAALVAGRLIAFL